MTSPRDAGSPDDTPVLPLLASRMSRKATLLRRALGRRKMRKQGKLAELAQLADEVQRAQLPVGGPRILLVQLQGNPVTNAYAAVLAQALRVRGADLSILSCGGGQPICEVGWPRRSFPYPCDRCSYYAVKMAEESDLRSLQLGDEMPWGRNAKHAPRSLEEVAGVKFDARAAVEISLAWNVRSSDPRDLAAEHEAAEDYAVAAAGVEQAARRILDRHTPDIVVMWGGIFAAERVIRDVALARGCRVVTYGGGYLPGTMIFAQDNLAWHYPVDALWDKSRDRPLADEQSSRLLDFMTARAKRPSGRSLVDSKDADAIAFRRTLGLREGRSLIAVFTNVTWDSATLARDVSFESMMSWVDATIAAAAQRPDRDFVIRVHPAEIPMGSRERPDDYIDERYGSDLPSNVRLIRAEDPVDSYALMSAADKVMVYTSTVGIEATMLGTPTIVAGEVHYAGRGFTFDIEQGSQFEELLDADLWVSESQRETAERYAYMFFFRYNIPFPAIEMDGEDLSDVPDGIDAIAPGSDAALDHICARILDGEDFGLADDTLVGGVAT